jgi:hypothetical protein
MAEVTIGNPLSYKNRTIYPGYQDAGFTFITYLASKTEAERVASTYGESFVSNDGLNPPQKYYVTIGGYNKGSSNFGVFPPGQDRSILSGISNNDLSLAIKQDRNFYNTVNQSPSNPNSPIPIPTSPFNPNQPGTPGTPAPSPDQEGGSTPINPTPANPSTPPPEKAFLTYPLKMKDDQDRIMFEAYEYQSGGRLGGGNFGDLNPVRYINPKGKVVLPIQSAITDQNAVGWESDSLNPIEIEAAKLSRDLMTMNTANSDIGTEAAKILSQALGRAKTGSQVPGANEAVRTYLVGQAIGVNNLLSRLQGQVLNPNLELLFQGPQLRPFSFTFKLSAREIGEAREIKQIIKYFKKNMAVKKENSIFLRAPNVFKIQYQYGVGRPHPGLNLIKMCALTNCSVDYTPLGSYMTYEDGTMVAYTISLSFQELTPIYDTDYDQEFNYGAEAGTVPATYYTQGNGIGP